jgi:hypothetical protein
MFSVSIYIYIYNSISFEILKKVGKLSLAAKLRKPLVERAFLLPALIRKPPVESYFH